MILYHFTSSVHVPLILADGYLKTVESNISARREHAGPDVVWLTTDGDPERHHGWQEWSPVDKLAVRFTVDIPKRDAHRWHEWAGRYGIDPAWRRALAAVGGSGTWRVVTRPIPAAEWVTIEHRHEDTWQPIERIET